MKLFELLNKYDRVRVATEEDNEELVRLYESQSMKSGGLTLKYTRKGDFFKFLQQQGRKSFTFLFCNDDASIGGLASYVITDGLVNGEVRPIAYLCDARVSRDADKETKQQWRRFYVETIENSHKIDEFENCEYMFLAILDANKVALRAFLKESSPLMFRPAQQYHSVQVIGKKWMLKSDRKLQGIKTRRVRGDERSQLLKFLMEANARKPLGASPSEVERRQLQWADFKTESFIVCENLQGEWLSVCAPTNFTESRSLVVERATKALLLLSKLARLFGGPVLKEKQDLKTTYFTHMEFAPEVDANDKLWCVRSFVDYVFKDVVTRDQNMLSFSWPAEAQVHSHPALKPYLAQVTSGTYYQVYPKFRESDLIKINDSKNVAFEVGLA